MALSGCLAVVTGGSGIVGAGIVHGFLSQGATTVAPCRSQKGAEARKCSQFLSQGWIKPAGASAGTDLKQLLAASVAVRQSLQDAPGLLSQLQTPLLDVSSEEEASKFVSSLVEQHGCIDHAVSCLGGWWQKGAWEDTRSCQHRILWSGNCLLCWQLPARQDVAYEAFGALPCKPTSCRQSRCSALSRLLFSNSSVLHHMQQPGVGPQHPNGYVPSLLPAGQLTQQSLEEFDQVVANQAKSHFVFSKALLPAMRPKDPTCTCSFTFVSGGAGIWGLSEWLDKDMTTWQPPAACALSMLHFGQQL